MRVHRGSIRDCLQRIEQLSLPYGFKPFSKYWRFRRERHERGIAQIIARLRVLADDLEFAVYGEINDQK